MPNLAAFGEEFMKSILIPIKDRVTVKNHPELYKKIHALCEKAKIKPPESILIVEEAFGMPNAMMSSKHLMLGEELLKLFNYDKEGQLVSKELEAIIGHELGHSTRIIKDMAMVHGPLTLGPLLAFAGYKLYEHSKKRQQEKGSGGIQQHIEITSKELERAVGKKIDEEAPPEQSGALHNLKKFSVHAAKDIAIFTALSLAFIPVAKFTGRRVEFAADSYAAKLVGGEHVVKALKILDQKVTEVMTKREIPEFWQNALRAMDYHPSTASRIANLGH